MHSSCMTQEIYRVEHAFFLYDPGDIQGRACILPVCPRRYIGRVSSRIFGLGGKNSVRALASEIFGWSHPFFTGHTPYL